MGHFIVPSIALIRKLTGDKNASLSHYKEISERKMAAYIEKELSREAKLLI
jgi:hypothetical protein